MSLECNTFQCCLNSRCFDQRTRCKCEVCTMSEICNGLQMKGFTPIPRIEFHKIRAQPWIPVLMDWTEAPNFARLQCSSTWWFGGEGCAIGLPLASFWMFHMFSTRCYNAVAVCYNVVEEFRGGFQLSSPTARCWKYEPQGWLGMNNCSEWSLLLNRHEEASQLKNGCWVLNCDGESSLLLLAFHFLFCKKPKNDLKTTQMTQMVLDSICVRSSFGSPVLQCSRRPSFVAAPSHPRKAWTQRRAANEGSVPRFPREFHALGIPRTGPFSSQVSSWSRRKCLKFGNSA